MNDDHSTRAGPALRGVLFLCVQAALLAVVVGAAVDRRNPGEPSRLPAMRPLPLTVGPLYDRPEFISDDQLAAVLYKLRPRLAGPKPKINHVDHALRFWGVEAEFRDPACLAGRQLRDLLLNQTHFAEAWGERTEPLLQPGALGVGVRTQQGAATASHVDHTLAGLAEVGTPLDFPIRTPRGADTVRSLLEASLRTFDLNQVEYEWSALAYVLYLESTAGWRDVNGQPITFDRLANRLMRQRLNQGVCYGNHRLHTLVMFLRVDAMHPILSPACRRRVFAHLRHATEVLVASQDPAGFWNQYWATGSPPVAADAVEQGVVDAQGRRILATGHVLEWWALAPREVLPPDDVIEQAAQWIASEVLGMDDEAIRKKYTFLSHAGRALALWRGHFPAYFLPAIEESIPCGT